VLPYTLELHALRRMPTSTFAVLVSLGPAIAAVAGLLVLGQSLAAGQIAAIVVVVAASAGAVRTSRPTPMSSGQCSGQYGGETSTYREDR
jgi:inner membrane transporter RhtA